MLEPYLIELLFISDKNLEGPIVGEAPGSKPSIELQVGYKNCP
jgi:hypothetical protein